ncbi:MAG: envelope stress response membrane protein PspB [Hyphomonas sp.]
MPEAFIPLLAIICLFVVLPGMVFHYITLWRRQKTLQPDDERMLEDLWRSAKAMERRIETLESLLEAREAETRRPPRPARPSFDD